MKTPFHFLIFKVFHAQRNKIRQNMDAYGLYPGQPKVLRYISNHRDCKLKDIAQECDVECATVSKLLNNLEDMGMLTRMVDQKNKRALQLNITDKGKQALTKWNAHCKDVEELSLKGFNEEERKQFEEYLSRMYHNLSGRTIE
ncbi:MarR family winged helix-turn-helix transcriptional regulator [[Eubacterium] hominis]|uniref:MarR family winged helix-turn-helix transcriptional regulator n=1 Tax=[Eubacterium] hominis TaxID=2764325 RepID=UPI003A4D7197